MAYIGTQPKDVRSFGKAQFDFTATASQTVFTGADDDGKTLGFTEGQVAVYVNGILLDASDYTLSGGTTVTLASAANANDILTVVALQTDIPNSNYVPSTGGTFTGPVTHTGSFASQGIDDNATSTAITIDSSENVLVGKAATGYNTAVGTELWSNGFSAFTRDNAVVSYYNRKTADGDIVQYLKDGSTVGSIGSLSGGNFYIGTPAGNSGYLLFADNQVSPATSTGAARDAAIDFGNPTRRFKDAYLSGGVYLGGTGSANLLDDHEEGVCNIVIKDSSGNSATMIETGCRYTKTGNLVYVTGTLAWSSTAAMTTTRIQFHGLPFTSASSPAAGTYRSPALIGSGSSAAFTIPRAAIAGGMDPNNSFIWGTYVTGNNVDGALNKTHLGTYGYIYGFALTYHTN